MSSLEFGLELAKGHLKIYFQALIFRISANRCIFIAGIGLEKLYIEVRI